MSARIIGVRVRYAALRYRPDAFSVFVRGRFDFRVGEVSQSDDGRTWMAHLRAEQSSKPPVSQSYFRSRRTAATWLALAAGVAAEPERELAA